MFRKAPCAEIAVNHHVRINHVHRQHCCRFAGMQLTACHCPAIRHIAADLPAGVYLPPNEHRGLEEAAMLQRRHAETLAGLSSSHSLQLQKSCFTVHGMFE
jgi:hypothetical protein